MFGAVKKKTWNEVRNELGLRNLRKRKDLNQVFSYLRVNEGEYLLSKIGIPKPENFDKVNVTKPPVIVTSNKYDLHGGNVTVTYGASGVDGKPYLNYSDSNLSRLFKGDEIRVIQETDLGTLVSVTIRMTIDSGSTSFTVFIPRVKMTDGQAASTNIVTVGITTLHRFSIVSVFMMGQIDHYTAITLSGTASLETYIQR
jgi:hypothetical protein